MHEDNRYLRLGEKGGDNLFGLAVGFILVVSSAYELHVVKDVIASVVGRHVDDSTTRIRG
jgi:hypothetical protein